MEQKSNVQYRAEKEYLCTVQRKSIKTAVKNSFFCCEKLFQTLYMLC